MIHPEIGSIDTTPEQERGLAIAYATAKADRSTAVSAGDYFRVRVIELLDGWVGQYVSTVQKSRINDAFVRATDQQKAAVAQALSIDLDVAVPIPRELVAPEPEPPAQAPSLFARARKFIGLE